MHSSWCNCWRQAWSFSSYWNHTQARLYYIHLTEVKDFFSEFQYLKKNCSYQLNCLLALTYYPMLNSLSRRKTKLYKFKNKFSVVKFSTAANLNPTQRFQLLQRWNFRNMINSWEKKIYIFNYYWDCSWDFTFLHFTNKQDVKYLLTLIKFVLDTERRSCCWNCEDCKTCIQVKVWFYKKTILRLKKY